VSPSDVITLLAGAAIATWAIALEVAHRRRQAHERTWAGQRDALARCHQRTQISPPPDQPRGTGQTSDGVCSVAATRPAHDRDQGAA
jgi:hypothetical protein